MKKVYQYKCVLQSDIILTSLAATEGYKESLSYIPGSKFLGIIAKQKYSEADSQATLDIFHNGTVHFGDAVPMLTDEATVKIPFSWYYPKNGSLSTEIYLHHNIENSTEQLKQARAGYFSQKQGCFTKVDQNFAIKSAYDAKRRKSKDSLMYGYHSLKKGSAWTFSIEDNSGKYIDEINQLIIGHKTIGRSKSAEYGLVDISFLKKIEVAEEQTYNQDILIYAKSNLCFYDDFGKCTATPSVKDLVGTDAAEIVWKKSQVRSRNYLTWNQKRSNKDAERLIIESGSVFYVQLKETISSSFFENGIGSHRSEGFGKVELNPSFLMSKSEKLELTLSKKELSYQKQYTIVSASEDDTIFNILAAKHQRQDFDSIIDKKVNAFAKQFESDFKKLSNSQWGVLRNMAKNIENIEHFKELVFHKTFGFVYRGKSEKEWRTNGRRDKLESYLNDLEHEASDQYLPFVVKLSNQMAKSK